MSGRLSVFASGGGTNLQALLDHFDGGPGSGRGEVVLVVSDREGAGALERAERAGVASRVIPVAGRAEDEVASETLATLEEAAIDVVALAGYLRLVPPAVVERFRDRMINIHPALLPAFGGKGMYGRRIHEAVLETGCRVTGATVHLVDERYDTGRILAQWPVPVRPGDSAGTLAARVLRVEHRLYPVAAEAVLDAAARGEPPRALPVTTDEDGGSFFRLAGGEPPTVEEFRRVLGAGG
ncbi:MAG: phosphoribosylglycinamide formyltransferase [Gemmatimonadota bacterium]